MLFNSLEFLIFFPIVVVLYFSLPLKWRMGMLLAASYYFYMAWRFDFVALLLLSTAVDFYMGIRIGDAPTLAARRRALGFSLFCNLTILFSFKYMGFLNESVRAVVTALGGTYPAPYLDIMLPLGISFYTFQSLGYTIDVYRGAIEPVRNFFRFALYITFFPQLVAGPIERASSLLPQFDVKHEFSEERAASGFRLMLLGFFKKVLIADNLALFVDKVYTDPTSFGGPALLLATYLFAFQIYCDFSGYCDIAVGCARVLGFTLMQNFDRPYASTSVSEFWRRWHISLSTWFRDYVYMPLGGNRVALLRWQVNVLIVFLVSGLWHGANWTYVVWGGLHGMFLILERFWQMLRHRLPALRHREGLAGSLQSVVGFLVTFNLVCLSWIFFRASSMTDAMYVLTHVTDFSNTQLPPFPVSYWAVVAASITVLEIVHYFQSHPEAWLLAGPYPVWVRWTTYSCAAWAVLVYGQFSARNFIYFVF